MRFFIAMNKYDVYNVFNARLERELYKDRADKALAKIIEVNGGEHDLFLIICENGCLSVRNTETGRHWIVFQSGVLLDTALATRLKFKLSDNRPQTTPFLTLFKGRNTDTDTPSVREQWREWYRLIRKAFDLRHPEMRARA